MYIDTSLGYFCYFSPVFENWKLIKNFLQKFERKKGVGEPNKKEVSHRQGQLDVCLFGKRCCISGAGVRLHGMFCSLHFQ